MDFTKLTVDRYSVRSFDSRPIEDEKLEAILNAGRVALHGELHEIKRNYVRDRLVVRTEYPNRIRADFGTSCSNMENGGLLIRLDRAEDKKAVMKCLVENYDIDEVKVFEPSLNDIFVEYAGDAGKEE